jgi:hypothetical protein
VADAIAEPGCGGIRSGVSAVRTVLAAPRAEGVSRTGAKIEDERR